MNDDRRLARILSDPSRRTFLGFTGAAIALAFTTNLADPWTARGQRQGRLPLPARRRLGRPAARQRDPLDPAGRAAAGTARRHAVRADQGRLGDRRGRGVHPAGHGTAPRGPLPSTGTRSTWTRAGSSRAASTSTGSVPAARSARSAGPRPRRRPQQSRRLLKWRSPRAPRGRTGSTPPTATWRTENPDVIFHLGDYIYEYGIAAPTAARATPRCPTSSGCSATPSTATGSSTASTRATPTCRPPTSRAPWIVTWDDHEVLDNWAGPRAPAARSRQQDFLVIRANAFRAYWENLPMRLPQPREAARRPDLPPLHLRRPRGVQRARHPAVPRRPGVRRRAAARLRRDGSTPPARCSAPSRRSGCSTASATPGARWNVLAQQIAMCQLDYDPAPAQRLSMDLWDGYRAAKDRVINGMTERRGEQPRGAHRRHPLQPRRRAQGELRRPGLADRRRRVRRHLDQQRRQRQRRHRPACRRLATRQPAHPVLQLPARLRRLRQSRRARWQADFKVVPYIDKPGAPVSTRGSLVTLDGIPGLQAL